MNAWSLDDAIIAVVNDELITLKDLREYTHATYVSLVTEGADQKKIEEIMLDLEINGINKLIEDKVILSHAKKVGLIVREKLIEDRITDLKSKYPSEQIFLESLIDNGATITELKNKIRDQLQIKYTIDEEIRNKIFVNPQEVTDYYNKNIDNFQKKDRVNVDSIMIRWTENKDASRQKAKEALTRIQKGEDFKKVSKTISIMPSLGTIERGQLLADIEDRIFALKEGEISSPIETSAGIYIIKLNGHTPAEVASLSEVKTTITNTLFREKFRAKFTAWLEKLKKEAYVEIKK